MPNRLNRRILIEDATPFRMHPANRPDYRAFANCKGPSSGSKVGFVGLVPSNKRKVKAPNVSFFIQPWPCGSQTRVPSTYPDSFDLVARNERNLRVSREFESTKTQGGLP